jgi:hypothetical protein
MGSETGWIFGRYEPGAEYRSKPGDESVVQRRKVATFVRYKLSCEQLPERGTEGETADISSLGASNGEIAGERVISSTAAAKMILTDVAIDNEGGQGSGMYRATETWQHFSDWYDWTTLETDLGTTNPF